MMQSPEEANEKCVNENKKAQTTTTAGRHTFYFSPTAAHVLSDDVSVN
jgi:hypothetical protein